MKNVYVLLYEDFTALDVFGPVEVLGLIEDYRLRYVSLEGGIVQNRQGIRIETDALSCAEKGGILLIPGGFGSRVLIHNREFLETLGNAIDGAEFVLCVCTGSALAAKTGALDGRRATSNRIAFDWVRENNPGVSWDGNARWVADGKFYTSAGVSAGIDMALGFVRDQHGEAAAEEICRRMEYHWNR